MVDFTICGRHWSSYYSDGNKLQTIWVFIWSKASRTSERVTDGSEISFRKHLHKKKKSDYGTIRSSVLEYIVALISRVTIFFWNCVFRHSFLGTSRQLLIFLRHILMVISGIFYELPKFYGFVSNNFITSWYLCKKITHYNFVIFLIFWNFSVGLTSTTIGRTKLLGTPYACFKKIIDWIIFSSIFIEPEVYLLRFWKIPQPKVVWKYPELYCARKKCGLQ